MLDGLQLSSAAAALGISWITALFQVEGTVPESQHAVNRSRKASKHLLINRARSLRLSCDNSSIEGGFSSKVPVHLEARMVMSTHVDQGGTQR